jgi:hypothetical protein
MGSGTGVGVFIDVASAVVVDEKAFTPAHSIGQWFGTGAH